LRPIEAYKFENRTKIISKNEKFKEATLIYVFSNRKNTKYIVNVEKFKNSFYILKFHLKKMSSSKNKYNHLTREKDARRIIYTCIEIGLEIYKNNADASFGFIGSPTPKELQRSNTKYLNTKRIKVYKNFASYFFDPKDFVHHFSERISSYLILNKTQLERYPNFMEMVTEMFTESYDIDSLFL
jgi:hypothetical protein